MGPQELQELKRAVICPADLLASAFKRDTFKCPAFTWEWPTRGTPEGGWWGWVDAEVPENCKVIHHINESCHFIYLKKKTFSIPWMFPTIVMLHFISAGWS